MKNRTLGESFSFAISGVVFALHNERNMKIHFLAGFLAVILGFILGIDWIEWGMLCITIFIVVIAELLNTAVEKTVDLVIAEYHPLAKIAKNTAAGAVLLSAVNALIMAYIIFWPHLF